jgi:hypothetical protein
MFRRKILLTYSGLKPNKEQQEVSVEQRKDERFAKEMGVTEENLPYYKCVKQIVCPGI